MDREQADKDLLRLLKNNSSGAFETIYNEYRETVYLTAAYTLKDSTAALDVIQDVFQSLWLNRNKTEIKSLRAYLIVTARNRSNDILKRKLVHDKFMQHEARSEKVSYNDALEKKDLRSTIENAIQQINSPLVREVFRLVYIEGRTHKETAEQLGITGASSRVFVSRAIKMIKPFLKKSR